MGTTNLCIKPTLVTNINVFERIEINSKKNGFGPMTALSWCGLAANWQYN